MAPLGAASLLSHAESRHSIRLGLNGRSLRSKSRRGHGKALDGAIGMGGLSTQANTGRCAR